MEILEADRIDSLDIKLRYKGDLLYHEGPILSHFESLTQPQVHYLYKWCDCDEQYNRWLIFKVEAQKLALFLHEKMTLLELIKENKFVYFIDLDTHLNQVNTFLCPTQKIPTEYLPTEKSYFKENQYQPYAIDLKNSNRLTTLIV
ncbi:MAG: hypothetical protein JJT94_00750 [Bernardetiaceae bacterium]|nr:hypothetical protein [Bernardetiaceae bacterium]